MKGFEEQVNGSHQAVVYGTSEDDNITLHVGALNDTITLEQESEDSERPDVIIVWSREDARQLIDYLQTWVDAE